MAPRTPHGGPGGTDCSDAHRVRSVQLHRTHGSARRGRQANDPPWHWALGMVMAMLLVLALGAWIDEIDAEAGAAPVQPAAAASAHGSRGRT
jgi:hypothetical protein